MGGTRLKVGSQRAGAKENDVDDGSDRNCRPDDMRVCYIGHDRATGTMYKEWRNAVQESKVAA